MGTPDFAVGSLSALIEGGYNVVGVVTTPDKPVGRGLKVQSSAVKIFTEKHNIPILQPIKLKDEGFLSALKEWNADLQVVVAFRMLPELVWKMPLIGTFNLHASLLPKYRGAAPINWAIINGEKETGVTTFFLSHEIDTGSILFQETEPIYSTDTAETLHDRLMVRGSKLVCRTIDALCTGTYKAIPQNEIKVEGELPLAPKLYKENCAIQWGKRAEEIYNFVRGLSPYPVANTSLYVEGKEMIPMKIYEVEPLIQQHSLEIGKIIKGDDGKLWVTVQDGYVKIVSLQVAGKKRVQSSEWLRGFRYMECSHF